MMMAGPRRWIVKYPQALQSFRKAVGEFQVFKRGARELLVETIAYPILNQALLYRYVGGIKAGPSHKRIRSQVNVTELLGALSLNVRHGVGDCIWFHVGPANLAQNRQIGV